MNLDAANYETPSHRKSSTSPGFLSPEQESMLSKLRAQELSLNKQHESIQAMLGQLDKSFKGRSILSPNPSTMKPKDRDRLDVKENIPSWGTINNHHSPINGIQSAIAASQRQLQKMRAVRDAAMQQRLQCHSSSLSTPQARPSLQPTLDLSFNSPSGVNTNRVIRHSPSETVAALKQAISDVQDPPVNRKTHSSRASDTNYIPLQQFAKEQAVPASKVKLKSQHGKTSIAVNPELGANSRQYVEAARDSLTRLRQDRIEAGEERQKMKLKAAEALQRQQQERIAQERDRIDAELADTFCRSYCFKRFITRIQHLMKQQQQLYTGNYAHTRNVLRGAIRRLQRSQLHRVLLGDYSYRRAWKMFQKRFFAGVRSHFQLLQSIEIAYQHRLRKNFMKFSSKLRTLRWLRRYHRIDLDAHCWKHTGGSVLNRLLKRVYYSHQPTLAEATMQRLRRKSLLKDAIVFWRNYSSMRRRCKYLVRSK